MLAMMLVRYLARDLVPHIERSRCLHLGSSETCIECGRVCPTEAINISSQIEFDEKKCRGCGACISACPVRCLHSPHIDWSQTLEHIMLKCRAEFGCPASKNPAINTVVPCLGGIPAELFAATDQITKEIMTLDLGPCRRCNNRKVIRQLKASLRQASKLSGRPIHYMIINSCKKELPFFINNETNQLKISSEEMGRLKTIWADRIGKFFSAQIYINHLNYTDQAVKGCSELNPIRAILVKAANHKENVSFSLPSWQVSVSCTGCNRCVGSCLQNAWDFVFKDNAASLVHYPLRCTGCGCCSASCPHGALLFNRATWSKTDKKTFIKKSFVAMACISCQRMFIVKESSDKRCKSCINREKLRSSIMSATM